jgi:hypothetical protein
VEPVLERALELTSEATDDEDIGKPRMAGRTKPDRHTADVGRDDNHASIPARRQTRVDAAPGAGGALVHLLWYEMPSSIVPYIVMPLESALGGAGPPWAQAAHNSAVAAMASRSFMVVLFSEDRF